MLTLSPALRKLIFLVSFTFAIIIFAIISCRKIDHQTAEEPLIAKQESKFFTTHPATDSLVQTILKFVKRENDKYHFADNLIKKIGYPYWNKAIITHGKAGANARVSSDSTNTIFIPFVLDSANTVNTTLIVKTSPSDTNFLLIADWQYKNQSYGSPLVDSTAEKVALLFMMENKNVFGYNRFTITDSNLFRTIPALPNSNGREIIINTPNEKLGIQSKIALEYEVEVCFITWVCRWWEDYCEDRGGCDYMNCHSTTNRCSYTSECFYYYYNVDAGQWGTGGGGGPAGGDPTGGSGPGWNSWEPPVCEEQPTGKLSVYQECDPGWTPPGIIVPIEAPAEPIDSLLAKYSRAMNRVADSIYDNFSQPSNREFFFAGIRDTDGDVKTRNHKSNIPARASDSSNVIPNPTISSGQILLFYWHSHVSRSFDPKDRGSFSHADIHYLRRPECLKKDFISFADCRDKRYALVIVDPVKAQSFFTNNDYDTIVENYYTTVGTDYQTQQELCIKNVIGSSAISGIAFYVSSNSDKTAYTLLNP